MTTVAIHQNSNRLRNPPYRITVDQYDKMIETGLLPEGAPYELIDGQIVQKDRSAKGEDPMTVGNRHIWVVQKLTKLNSKLERLGCYMRPQQPIALQPDNEPEPDGAIVRGNEDDYLRRKPAESDVLCVIEVAESSLQYDRTIKYRLYANVGIPQYIIINLVDEVVEVYSQPAKGRGKYNRTETFKSGQRIAFPSAKGKGLIVPVRQLLP
ncbi:MAG TPA: Uma2 family endonuclease [Tepidisphaeraceae bacterium]|nr:Uma2 family endonuclease [Tepidisphaeraceae bacterium]